MRTLIIKKLMEYQIHDMQFRQWQEKSRNNLGSFKDGNERIQFEFYLNGLTDEDLLDKMIRDAEENFAYYEAISQKWHGV
jgi:hypothetical protein